MQELRNENAVILYRSNAKENIVNRYSVYQKNLILESGMGCTIEAVEAHFSRLHQFLAAGKLEESQREAENLHYGIFSQLNKANYQSRAFACLVHSINGELQPDYSEDGIDRMVNKVSELGFTQQEIEEVNEDVKKK